MPLTVRTNGSLSSNIITASWFNDIRDLLTGTMADQEVSIKNNLVLEAIGAAPSAAPSAALATGTALGVGAYKYTYTFVSPDGESIESPTASITTTTNNQSVSLSSIAVGPTGTTARNLYRTKVGQTQRKFLAAINDNTATTYTDTTTDAGLGANAPTAPSFGGSLVLKDSTGAVTFKINNDGSFTGGASGQGSTTINGTLTVTGSSSLDNGKLTTDGNGNITKVGTIANSITSSVANGGTSGTLTTWVMFNGTLKVVVCYFNNFKNGAGQSQTINLPTFTTGAHISIGDAPGVSFNLNGGSAVNVNLQSGIGTFTNATNTEEMSVGDVTASFNRMVTSSGNNSTHNGWIYIVGV